MIACLGWGSLVWNSDTLPIIGDWQSNGPQVRVEFLRQSKDGRMTLVLTHAGVLVPSHWAALDVDTVQAGVAALARREDTEVRNIGWWSRRTPPTNRNIANLDTWAESIGAEHVVWTDLPPKFNGRNHVIAAPEDVIACLRCLTGERATLAEEYVRRAPAAVRTPLRQLFEDELSWLPRS